MAQNFEVHAQIREGLGTSHSRRMRRVDNRIPAVIYGGGLESTPLSIDHNQITKSLENEAFYSHVLTIHTGNKTEKAILRAIHRHPYKPKILHMDFQRISAKEKLTMHVPLHFTGEDVAPGVKGGGMVSHLQTSVEVSCLPADLPEYIEVDVSGLNIEHSIHLSALKLPKGVEFVALSQGHDNDLAVVSIHLPRAAKEEVEEVTPETEVINEKAPAAEEDQSKES
jgi:large subunit ribosomal protein L25